MMQESQQLATERQADMIRQYWIARGFDNVSVVVSREHGGWVIKSNLVNGLPPVHGKDRRGA